MGHGSVLQNPTGHSTTSVVMQLANFLFTANLRRVPAASSQWRAPSIVLLMRQAAHDTKRRHGFFMNM